MSDTNCKDCGQPVHWFAGDNQQEPGWMHDRLTDILFCPGFSGTQTVAGPA